MKRIACLLILFFLVACAPVYAPPTATPTLTPAPTQSFSPTPEPTETPTPTPEQIVIAGGEAARAGITVGAELKGSEYVWHNPVTNRDVVVGSLDASGKPVKAEFLNYGLVSCTESLDTIVANELPADFAINGGANKIAILTDNEPFPETVLLGQKIEKSDRTAAGGEKFSILRWSKEIQRTFNADPEKLPHKIVGCFSVKSDGSTYIGIVHKWQNLDGSYRYITTFKSSSLFYDYPVDKNVFVLGWFSGIDSNPTDKFTTFLCSDPKRNNILQQWVDTQSIPLEAEDSAFLSFGPYFNYK